MRRQISLNMPHMAIGGMSEAWLFRELGDMHWNSICGALSTTSASITDDSGNRLYATFVRFRWEGTGSLRSFRENDDVVLTSLLTRFGGAMYFSDCQVTGPRSEVRARLMTTFASRDTSNTGLLKGQPRTAADNPVPTADGLPEFAEEYRRRRSGSAVTLIELSGEQFQGESGEPIGEVRHTINPYQDFNGVNLLYFAAYPTISDTCERRFVHERRNDFTVERDWALESSTIGRDVYYYGNCEIDDEIVYRLDEFVPTPNGRTIASATLRRVSDGQRISSVFTVKERHR